MSEPDRILISIPNWVGDVVMATAALRAVRRRFSNARIVHLMRPYVAEVLAGTGFGDEDIFWPTRGDGIGDARQTSGHADLIRRLRGERFDLAILLTNSFRSALVARLAGTRQRVGYARNGRSWLLTDRLEAPQKDGQFAPIPALDYYNALARHVGCGDPGDRLELATLPGDEAAIERRLAGISDRKSVGSPRGASLVPRRPGGADATGSRWPGRGDATSPAASPQCDSAGETPTPQSGPLIVLNPGANYGSAKCWPPEYYAELADALVERFDARVVASLVPKEREIAERLARAARRPIDIFVDPPLGLGPLKALVRRCDLLITNDTGPRHFAAAFDVPVVTIFGSSDPAWTDTRFAKERIVTLKLPCQPCMERTCPLKHHDCMRQLPPAMVLEKVEGLLAARGGRAPAEVGRPCS